MIIDESTLAGLLNTNDHPGLGCGKYCCIRHLCLPLILAVPMKAKKCHYLLHLKHFSSASCQLGQVSCFSEGTPAFPGEYLSCCLTLRPLPTLTLVGLAHRFQVLSFRLKLASCV